MNLRRERIISDGFRQFIVCLNFFVLIFSSLSSEASAQHSDTLVIRKEVELKEVEIIGRRTAAVYMDLARKVTVINREEIVSFPASTLQDLLEYVAGIDVRQRNTNGVQADIQLRGGTFDQVMVLLNGINISDPQTGHFALDLPVELSSIERIEVLHGTGARVYGANAYKGVINIITKKSTDQFCAGIKYGQYNLLNTNISGGLTSGRLYNSIGFSRSSSDGYTENTDFRINHLFYQGGYNFGAGNFSWQGGMSNNAFGANDFYSPRFPEQYEETASRFASIGFTRHGKINYSFAGYWRRHNDHFLLKRNDPLFYENFHKTDILGLKGNADFTSIFGKTSFGIEVREEMILSNRLGDLLNDPIMIRGTDSIYYSKYFNRNNLSYFLEQSYILGKFSFTGGILLDQNNTSHDETGIYPGMDISYNFLSDKAKVFVSLNRSLRQPTFTDMFYEDPSNEGNRDLVAEKLVAFEAGSELRKKNFLTNLTFFTDNGKQVIDWVWQSDRNLYKAMNITQIKTRGIEFSADYYTGRVNRNFMLKNLGTSFSTIGLVKNTGEYVSKYALDFLRYKVDFHSTLNFTRKISANLQVSYLSRSGTYPNYDSTTGNTFASDFDPYWLTDFKINYTDRICSVYLDTTNLFNSEYRDVGNLTQPGRWISAGIQLTFSGKK
jgi:vitamin B12 transporter